MRALVTGGAGFIGSHLADRLVADGHSVTVFDNLSTGHTEFLDGLAGHPRFAFVRGDLLDADALADAVKDHDIVFHLAANADVRHGLAHPRRDLDQNTVGTFNVLEAARRHGVGRLVFASTGSVYGEPDVFPTPETCPFPIQTSLYGASKVAAEGLIAAYCEGFGLRAWIFRFVSILGERYTHGHVFDFYQKLRADPTRLEILGDGTQRKSYLYVGDCTEAILIALDRADGSVNVLNLGTDEYCSVNESVDTITSHLGLSPRRVYSGGPRGWVGDSPFIFLDCARIRALGWRPKRSIREGILKTLDYLREHPWLLSPPSRG